jgi:hypothetical protein
LNNSDGQTHVQGPSTVSFVALTTYHNIPTDFISSSSGWGSISNSNKHTKFVTRPAVTGQLDHNAAHLPKRERERGVEETQEQRGTKNKEKKAKGNKRKNPNMKWGRWEENKMENFKARSLEDTLGLERLPT